LRLEFDYRCAYCLASETEVASGEAYGAFEVEHFRPESRFETLAHQYSNLMWTCGTCNAAKADYWPSPAQEAAGKCWVDPTTEALGRHLQLQGEHLAPLTITGDWIIQRLRLDGGVHEHRRKTRCRKHTRLMQLRAAVLGHDAETRAILLGEIAELEKELSNLPWDPVNTCRCPTPASGSP
jgi:hypothetical protein